MARYKCRRGVVLPDPNDPMNPHGIRWLKDEVFEAEPPTRAVKLAGKAPIDWLDWAVSIGVIHLTDEALTGPGRDSAQAYPVEQVLREDGSLEDPEPEMEHMN